MTLSTQIQFSSSINESNPLIFISTDTDQLPVPLFTSDETTYIKKKVAEGEETVMIVTPSTVKFFHRPDTSLPIERQLEKARISANKIFKKMHEEKLVTATLVSKTKSEATMAFIEGILLSSYQFEKYKSKKEVHSLGVLEVVADIDKEQLHLLKSTVEGVFVARDLVNEPANTLDAIKLPLLAAQWGKTYGFSVETLHKKAIEKEKMGGLLAVNQGSTTPPTFTILEWKPKQVNEKPIVLVGKGIMFDTGGFNLKVQPGSLDDMKSDMAGAAAVIGIFIAASKANLPVHLVGLIPATDNRLGNNALVPGDIITMHSGTTVEILNTDAEGRLILADAISFADRYEPELIVELSTLTGSTVMTLGNQGIAAMGSANSLAFTTLEEAGDWVSERIARFPFWEEYDELIKSDVADIKNIGGREAGAITAGKFLSRFTQHPFIHLDIAGTAFARKENGYRGHGASGVGVRLLTNFLTRRINKPSIDPDNE